MGVAASITALSGIRGRFFTAGECEKVSGRKALRVLQKEEGDGWQLLPCPSQKQAGIASYSPRRS